MITLSEKTLKDLLSEATIQSGVCSAREAMKLLGLATTDFYSEISKPESRIVKSKKRGKFIYRSVLQEFERIHGTPYKEAI